MQDTNLKTAGKALEISDEISVLTSGVSMEPMLRQHRDLVIIKRTDRPFKKGDVVLYPNGKGAFVLHRIISFKNNSPIIRGDNNYFTERDVKLESIVGILKEFYRNGKYVNCEKSLIYKLYTFYICHSYPLRYFWKKKAVPFLVKIKHLLFRT